jgi:hypothetical protein
MKTLGELRKLYEIKLSKELGIDASPEEIIQARLKAADIGEENEDS